jgi:hypothetical protein
MNIIVVGARKEGKTTLAMWLLSQRHKGIVVFDPRGMVEGEVVHDPQQLEEAIKNWSDHWDGDHRHQRQPIVYRFDSSDHDQEFTDFCSIIFPPRFTIGGFGVLVDEAGMLQGANSIHPELARAIKQHPMEGQCLPGEEVTIVQTMHVLGESWAKGRSLINELYMFRLTSPSDTKAIVEYTGKPELVEVIENLPQHHCVRYINDRQPAGTPEYIVMDDSDEWHIGATANDPKTLRRKGLDNSAVWASNSPVRVL